MCADPITELEMEKGKNLQMEKGKNSGKTTDSSSSTSQSDEKVAVEVPGASKGLRVRVKRGGALRFQVAETGKRGPEIQRMAWHALCGEPRILNPHISGKESGLSQKHDTKGRKSSSKRRPAPLIAELHFSAVENLQKKWKAQQKETVAMKMMKKELALKSEEDAKKVLNLNFKI